jgi:hypothetical protein
MVWNNQPKGAIHLFDGCHLSTIWRKGLLQVFGSMDAFGVHNGDRQEKLQMGSNNLKKIEHLCIAGSNSEGRGVYHFLHCLIPTRCHVH